MGLRWYALAVSQRPRALLAWSSGKDSAWALHVLRQRGEVEVVGLLTTINAAADRVAMHAVRSELLRAQADAAGLPLWPVPDPVAVQQRGVRGGDGGGGRPRARRRRQRDGVRRSVPGRRAPLPRGQPARLRHRAAVPAVGIADRHAVGAHAGRRAARAADVRRPPQLDARFAGREYDAALLAELPPSVDPCGENGEFHTFAYDGPMFTRPVALRAGEVVTRDGFVFADP